MNILQIKQEATKNSNLDIYESNENYQNIYNEETRKEVSRSQKLKDKLDELINRSKNRKE